MSTRTRVAVGGGAIALLGVAAAIAVSRSGPPSELEIAGAVLREFGPQYGIELPQGDSRTAPEILAEFGSPWGFVDQPPDREVECNGWSIFVLEADASRNDALPEGSVYIDSVGGVAGPGSSDGYSFDIYGRPKSRCARVYAALHVP